MTSTDLMNVNAFANMKPNAAFAGLNPEQESLADGIGSSYGIIGYRGKVWTLRHRGETYTFKRLDDGSPSAFLDVVILRQAQWKSKSFYPAGSFTEGNTGDRPVCASIDGVNPDIDVKERQAAACAICPRNTWKTDANGRKSRECSDYKRLAVLILPNQTKPLLGAPLLEPVFLRVPPASLNDLATFGEAMKQKGFHYSTFVTRIGFQADKAHPQMVFKALQALTEKEAPVVLQLREDQNALRITGESDVGKLPPANGSATAALPQTSTASSTQPVSAVQSARSGETPKPQSSSPIPQSSTSSSTASPPAASAPASQSTTEEQRKIAELQAQIEALKGNINNQPKAEIIPPAATTSSASSPVAATGGLGDEQPVVDTGFDTGFGDAEAAGGFTAAVTAAPTNTVEDTGPAEEADDDLEARVANLLK